ncbi:MULTISPECIES: DUF2933 domain-containing protein [Paenibacillus]|uniref:DUF2933 domain-containing protein n=1 Tax=Paenibacillus validus TaxID=44253 RepID=A0A7X2ZH01_9BACL|nr:MULTISPECIES: DUF2933 domain-containing protein [Paenibacillus]MUG73996.1 DUF2933 domain-containing protein [Paenibacillus validus]
MNWLQLLAFLACPLMMLFCMKGMFGGNKNKKTGAVNTSVSQQESQQLQIKMADLMEQNHKQMKEIEDLKAKQSNNVVQLADERLSKWEIS